jgi:hypothetical protein
MDITMNKLVRTLFLDYFQFSSYTSYSPIESQDILIISLLCYALLYFEIYSFGRKLYWLNKHSFKVGFIFNQQGLKLNWPEQV